MLSPTTPTAPETGFPALGAGAGAGAGAWGALGFGFDVCAVSIGAASICAAKVIGAMIRAYSQRDCMPNSIGCDRIGNSAARGASMQRASRLLDWSVRLRGANYNDFPRTPGLHAEPRSEAGFSRPRQTIA